MSEYLVEFSQSTKHNFQKMIETGEELREYISKPLTKEDFELLKEQKPDTTFLELIALLSLVNDLRKIYKMEPIDIDIYEEYWDMFKK